MYRSCDLYGYLCVGHVSFMGTCVCHVTFMGTCVIFIRECGNTLYLGLATPYP